MYYILNDNGLLIIKLICLFALIVASAFFSGAEAALFSLNKLKLKQIGKRGEDLAKLLKEPRRLLTTLLIGTTVVNVSASALATTISIDIFRKIGMGKEIGAGVAIGVMTLLILVFGEIIPITIGVAKGTVLSPIVTPLVKFFVILLSPFRIILTGITNIAVSIVERHKFFAKESEDITNEEIKTVVDLGKKEGILKEHERMMIHSIFEFGDTIVSQIMVKKEEMDCVTMGSSVRDVLNLIKSKGHSRIPIYKDSFDNIIGIINTKDILAYLKNGIEKGIPCDLIKKPYFVSDSMKVNELFREFQKKRIQMAIVRDRNGTIIGLVTLEDLLEEIVGEIHDEYEKESQL